MYFKLLGTILLSAYSLSANSSDSTKLLYKEHCALCHGFNRQGISAPALLPQNLQRLRKKQAIGIITYGKQATQMPAFEDKLGEAQIKDLADYVYTPVADIKWSAEKISQSHIVYEPQLIKDIKNKNLHSKPVFDADPLNIFLVVETGDHSITVLDGDKFEPIYRFKTRHALHGGLKYSPDGRFVYLTSRDGWISKFDLYTLSLVAEIRVGINSRNSAISADGRWLAVANYLPHSLVILQADDLSLKKVIEVKNSKGKSSRVSAVYNAAPRNSFIAALKDIKEIWEIKYQALVSQQFSIRKIPTKIKFDDFFFNQEYTRVIGAERSGKAQVIDLSFGYDVAEPELSGMPHLASGITWNYKGTTVLATPNLKKNAISIIDTKTWKLVKNIPTLGSGFFIRSHKNSRYAWADVFFGEHKDKVHIIDKQTLSIIKTLQPIENKTSAHVEFTKDGKYALLSIWENDGYVIVYDADNLNEIKRLPMKKPAGKYNVYNKITLDEGTSH